MDSHLRTYSLVNGKVDIDLAKELVNVEAERLRRDTLTNWLKMPNVPQYRTTASLVLGICSILLVTAAVMAYWKGWYALSLIAAIVYGGFLVMNRSLAKRIVPRHMEMKSVSVVEVGKAEGRSGGNVRVKYRYQGRAYYYTLPFVRHSDALEFAVLFR